MADTIIIDSQGTPIHVELFKQTRVSNGGVIVVAHGSDGMNEPSAAIIRQYATGFAAKGFTALIPAYFGVELGAQTQMSGAALQGIRS